MTITSHTLVKNGMPFIGTALRLALPYVNRMLITISAKADEATVHEIFSIRDKKIEIAWENVSDIGDLTTERQRQIDKTVTEWVWFLDDDDLYPPTVIENVISHMSEDVDGFAISPYHLVGDGKFDEFFLSKKFFTKFFRTGGIKYDGAFPRDLIYKHNNLLHWKWNKRVKILPYHFFHVALLKDSSFRNEHPYHAYETINPVELPEEAASWLRREGIARVFEHRP